MPFLVISSPCTAKASFLSGFGAASVPEVSEATSASCFSTTKRAPAGVEEHRVAGLDVGFLHALPVECGAIHLREHWEARKQVALADAIVLTQRDCAPENVDSLRETVAQLNPGAPQFDRAIGDVDPQVLLAPGSLQGWPDLGTQVPGHAHGEITSLALVADEPLDWLRRADDDADQGMSGPATAPQFPAG